MRKNKPNLQIRVRSHNIIKLLPGTKGDARNAATEIECLKLFLNETIVRIITASTNIYIYIEKVRTSYQRTRDSRYRKTGGFENTRRLEKFNRASKKKSLHLVFERKVFHIGNIDKTGSIVIAARVVS